MCLRYQGSGKTFSFPDLAILPQVAKSEIFMEISSGGWPVLLQPWILVWIEIILTEKRCCKSQVPLDFYPPYPEVCKLFVT